MYAWTSDQVNSGLSSEIEWKRGEDIRLETITQLPELIALKEAIESTSEKEEVKLELSGLLVGIDIPNRTFHMSFEEGEDIRGKFTEALVTAHFEIPKFYTAKILQTKIISYSTEKEITQHFLLEMK